MALDRALMRSVREGSPPILRFYRWNPRCLSLGRNQPARGRYNEDAIRERGIDVVRRDTGGRAVLHDRELTYAAVFPDGSLGGPRASYAAINRALVAGLRRLGVAAELAPRGGHRAAILSLDPCFREAAEGEVVVAGRKLIGSAQWREAGVTLQHGSLLLAGDQAEARDLLLDRVEGEASPATLSELRDPLPAWGSLVGALAAGWAEALDVDLRPSSLTWREDAAAARESAHYADPARTWRL